jgi:negative regulator of flagellin synthesis FlgM
VLAEAFIKKQLSNEKELKFYIAMPKCSTYDKNSRSKIRMKIDELNQNSAVAYLAASRVDKVETSEPHGEIAAKQSAGSDKVELSSYMPVVPASKREQGLRANRVEEVKAQIASGSYQVSGRAVAEKMLSKLVLSSSN